MNIPDPRPPVVPAEMSTAEKLAAEWEARHDVLARGHRADPLVLQHYLAHARTQELVGRGTIVAPRRPAAAGAAAAGGGTATGAPAEAPPADRPAPAAPRRQRRRRLFRAG